MDRVVLYGIPEESGGAGKQGMVLPHGQGPLCVCRSIQKMHRRDRATKKEMWNIIMDSKAEHYSRIQATKELHSLSKTSVLLLRDLPFVANLSKFYDEDMLNSNSDHILQSKNEYSNRNNQEIVKDTLYTKYSNKPENLDTPFELKDIKGKKTLAGESGLKVDKNPK